MRQVMPDDMFDYTERPRYAITLSYPKRYNDRRVCFDGVPYESESLEEAEDKAIACVRHVRDPDFVCTTISLDGCGGLKRRIKKYKMVGSEIKITRVKQPI